MLGFIWVVLIDICFAAAIYLGECTRYDRKHGVGDGIINERLSFFFGILCFLMCFAPLLFEFVPFSGKGSYVVAVRNDGSYTKYPYGCWEWTDGELYTVWSPLPESREILLNPDDPGTKLPYSVTLKISDPGIYFNQKEMDWKKKQALFHFFLVQLEQPGWEHDFREFTDPANQEQQRRFVELVLPWLNQRLAKYGLGATDASFAARTTPPKD